MTRRDFIRVSAIMAASFAMGAVGGMTAKENGSWAEDSADEQEPP